MFQTLKMHQFLLEELVKRDFKRKYKGAFLGVAWSVMNPLLTLLIMRIVFTHFCGTGIAHYTTYLFSGTLVFSFFSESTSEGLLALVGNAEIFTKVEVPKYLFLFSKNAQTFLNFLLTLAVFFGFAAVDRVTFTWRFVFLLYPVVMLLLFNLGIGMILSALFVFFRDMRYLWTVMSQFLMYLSAVFYSIDGFSPKIQTVFFFNPLFLMIRYVRTVVLDGAVPSAGMHLLIACDTAAALLIGALIYKKYDTEFLYYL